MHGAEVQRAGMRRRDFIRAVIAAVAAWPSMNSRSNLKAAQGARPYRAARATPLCRRGDRMKRREVLLGLATAAFGKVSAIRAQAAAKSLHMAAVLMTPPTASYWVAFMKRLRE